MDWFLKQDEPHPFSSVPLWRRINHLRNKKPKKIPILEENGIKYNADHDKAQVLADRLEDVFNEDKNNGYNKENFEISKPYDKREKLVKPFTMRDLKRSLKNINNKTSTDQHGISNKILKHISEIRKRMRSSPL